MIYSAPTPDAAPAPLPRADWHHHSVQQPSVRRFGDTWIDTAMAECYASPAHVGRPQLVLRHGHTITDGAKRAVLYMPPGMTPSDEQVRAIARRAGMKTEATETSAPDPLEPRVADKWADQRPLVWLGDTVVAYRGVFLSECGHMHKFFEARATFPRCDQCGRSVRWGRVET